MLIKKIYIEGIRNLQIPTKLELHQDLNIFVGANGAGKSSLLESIYVLAVGRSFRTSKLNNIIKFDRNYMVISAVYTNSNHNQIIKINTLKDRNKEKINKIGGAMASGAEVATLTPTQLINDETSDLIFKHRELRRKFIDWMAFYANKNYQVQWKEFNQILQQRNKILKSIQSGKNPQIIQMLQNVNAIFVTLAEQITAIRTTVWRQFEQIWLQIIAELDLQSFTMEIKFFKGWYEDLGQRLLKNQLRDVQLGYTQFGPHKADLQFIINNNSIAKEVLSRGQGKLLALAMILARSKFIQQMRSNVESAKSVLLIDDICSELDNDNIKKIVKQLCNLKKELQIFITASNINGVSEILSAEDFKLFKVACGRIVDS